MGELPAVGVADAMLQAMRRLAATVHIVTILADGEPMGLAATAVTSLSFSPASLLLCVNVGASVYPHMQCGKALCVNMLHADQADIVGHFSNSAGRPSRFTGVHWELGGPAPLLRGAQANLNCTLAQKHAFGTHGLLVAAVDTVRVSEAIDPLVYLAGKFVATCPLEAIDP